MKRLIYLLIFSISILSFSQEKRSLFYYNNSKLYRSKTKTYDSVSKTLDSLVNSGYFTLKKDSIIRKENDVFIYVKTGRNYEKTHLILDSISQKVFEKKEIYTHNSDSVLEKIKQFYVEKGFPFVSVHQEKDENGDIKVITKLRNKRTIDAFVFDSKEKLPKSYVKQLNSRYLNRIFNLGEVKKIYDDLNTNPHINQTKKPQILYTEDSTKIYLYPKSKKNSSFNGILGINSDEQEKTKLTGNVSLNLVNLFKSFEQISIAWRSTPLESSELNTYVSIPYLYKNYLSGESNINLYRQDSTYANIKLSQKLYHQINEKQSLGISFLYESSNYIPIASSDFEDYQKTGIGLHYNYKKRRNSRLIPFSDYLGLSLYSLKNKREISSNITQYQIDLKGEKLIPIYKKNHLNLSFDGFTLLSDEFQQNELRRVGGFNSILGFNEDVFFVSSYAIGSLEYRYLSSDELYLSVFTNYAWIENKLNTIQDRLFSTGFGFGFLTKFGVFSLHYALGKTSESSFDFQQSKIHIGIQSFF
ncbi:MAG: hypothetical protein H6604_07070 [Flavobacteriales bacterium]|nr:hypothetical protein [Flavobacteriales bacterium]